MIKIKFSLIFSFCELCFKILSLRLSDSPSLRFSSGLFAPLCLCVKNFFFGFLFVLGSLFAEESPYVIFYVDAPKLCYDNFETLCQTLAYVKENGKIQRRERQNVGHAWVSLHGMIDGRMIDLTVGHSGECGVTDRPYFQGVMDLVEKKDPNPVAYLFSTLRDGFPQLGSGGHLPTFAAKRLLTHQQLRAILRFIHPKRYPYTQYALTGRQCASFVAQIAALANCDLDDKVTVVIPQTMKFGGWHMRLWSHPRYSVLTFSSPDKIEEALRQLVKCREAEEVRHAKNPGAKS